MKTLYVPCYSHYDVIPTLEKHLLKLKKYGRLGLISTIQYSNQLKKAACFLNEHNIKSLAGDVILGCDQSNALKIKAEVDVFLYLGSGRFHPLGVALRTQKPVLVLNPQTKVVDEVTADEKKKWVRRRKGVISQAVDAKIVGVLVSTKSGQFNIKKALGLRDEIEGSGRRAFLFAGEELSPPNLLPFKVDVWVNTGCPRIVDDFFDKPVLSPDELKVIL